MTEQTVRVPKISERLIKKLNLEEMSLEEIYLAFVNSNTDKVAPIDISDEQLGYALLNTDGYIAPVALAYGRHPKDIIAQIKNSKILTALYDGLRYAHIEQVDEALLQAAAAKESWAIKIVMSGEHGEMRGYGHLGEGENSLMSQIGNEISKRLEKKGLKIIEAEAQPVESLNGEKA